MAWVKIDTGIFRNPKVVTVGADAKLLYLAGICYCGDNLTDGRIPANAVPILAAEATVKNSKRATDELVHAGLWLVIDGGFAVHDYLEHNSNSQKVQEKRDAAKERMQRNRSQDVRANESRTSQNVRPTKEERREEVTNTPLTPQGGEGGNPIITIAAPAKRTTLEERFEAFWSVCPRKVGKDAAWRWWERKKPDADLTEAMIAAMVQASQQPDWVRDGGRYIPHPTTWLNRGGWKDDLGPIAPAGPPGVELLPGEVAHDKGGGKWELVDGNGHKRIIDPDYCGVIYDSRKHMYDGLSAFYAAVNEAKARQGSSRHQIREVA